MKNTTEHEEKDGLGGIRTRGFNVANVALYQAELRALMLFVILALFIIFSARNFISIWKFSIRKIY